MGDELVGSGEMNDELPPGVHEVTGERKQEVLAVLGLIQRKLPYVWELTHQDKTSYAIGTMHSLRKQFTADIEQYIGGIQGVCLEITPDVPIHEPSTRLQKKTAAAFEALIAKTDEKTALDLSELALRFRGYLPLGQFLAGELPGVDGNIHDAAQRKNIPCHALETPEERYPTLVAYHFGFRLMLELADSNPELVRPMLAKMHKQLDDMEAAYLSGNALPDDPRGAEQMIKRNKNMARRGLERIAIEPTIIAAGNNHFVGNEPTMLTLFEEKGVKVKRIE